MTKTPFEEKWETRKLAHGVISTLGVISLVLGPILLRLIPGRYDVRVHYCFQLLGLSLYVTGFGIGAWLAVQNNSVSYKS